MKKIVNVILAVSLITMFLFSTFASAESGNTEGSNVRTKGSALIDSGEPKIEADNIIWKNEILEVSISPEKQSSKEGYAEYDVIIYDNHKSSCPDTGICEKPLYKYALSFESKHNMRGDLDSSVVYVPEGGKEIVKLRVQSSQRGTNLFKVLAEGEDSKASAKGLLIYAEEIPPKEPTEPYFSGKGFIVDETQKQGQLINLHLLREGEMLKGKLNIIGEKESSYRVEGTVSSDNVIKFQAYDNSDKESEEIGTFTGELKNFNGFLLINGKLSIKEQIWYLTAFSEKEKVFVEFDVPKTKTQLEEPTLRKVKIDDVISIQTPVETSEIEQKTKEVYIRPVEIKKEKIFGFIPKPNAKNILEIEIIDGNESRKEKIKEFEKKEISSYEVEVGSLADSQNIEISVESAH